MRPRVTQGAWRCGDSSLSSKQQPSSCSLGFLLLHPARCCEAVVFATRSWEGAHSSELCYSSSTGCSYCHEHYCTRLQMSTAARFIHRMKLGQLGGPSSAMDQPLEAAHASSPSSDTKQTAHNPTAVPPCMPPSAYELPNIPLLLTRR
jgi:hypothetical protein